ncbi:DUF6182 family protein [Streptomyces sp. NPDC023327]|uniref:DUF6182 family protein n=1 Tax=Streptomyces sp. NPDC023327 TaxID=3157088 RepID=UPI0033C7C900
MLTQEQLRRIVDSRVRAAGGRPARAPAVAVLRAFDPGGFARSALDFAARLSPEEGERWRADFTRTVFLAGNPRNLAGRLPPDLTAPGGQSAWYAPGARTAHRELRLLLRAVEGDLPPDPPGDFTLTVPGARESRARHRRMTVATADVCLPRYLVHVNHTLAESLLTGVLAPGDRLTVRHTPQLPEPRGEPAYVRVHQDPRSPERLRTFACVEEVTG